MEKLRECPFCNGKAYKQQKKTMYCQLHGEPHQDWGIYCRACNFEIVRQTLELVIKVWNHRPEGERLDEKELWREILQFFVDKEMPLGTDICSELAKRLYHFTAPKKDLNLSAIED